MRLKFDKWIKEQPCCLCGKFNADGKTDMHHVGDGVHHRRNVDALVPLCRVCHNLVHNHPKQFTNYLRELAMRYKKRYRHEEKEEVL
jgi:hypothetical protein